MKIRTMIVDDEPLAREGIKLLLRAHEDIEIVGESGDGYDAVEKICDLDPDLLFLDVQMPGLDGFGVLEALDPTATELPIVVFATAYDEYALRAFRVHAVDYLVKPIDEDLFAEALDRARDRLGRATGRDALSRELAALLDAYRADTLDGSRNGARRYLQRVLVKESGRAYFIGVENIEWLEAADNYVRIATGRRTHLVRGTMNEFEARLDPDRFARIHRRTIVNLGRIKEIRIDFRGDYEVVLEDGSRHRMSRGFRDAVLARGQ